MSNKAFSQLGRVEAIRLLFEGTPFKAFEDPCCFDASDKDKIISASALLLEGIDFDLSYFPLKHLGYKSIIQVTGELYAVMAHPQSLTVRIGVSSKLDFEQIRELWDGMISAARQHGYRHVSLDLCPSLNGLAISVSSTGFTTRLTSVRRPKIHSKDLICVSGSLGAAYMGQQVLHQRFDRIEQYKMLVASYLMPELSPVTVAQLEDAQCIPSYGYFVSKGLSDAILRLSRDCGMGAKVYADKIPFEGNSFALGRDLNIDPVSAAMNGGEDCRLLYVIPILQLEKFRKDFQTFDIIGHIARPDAGTVMVTPDGVELPLASQGWVKED